jgi:hypothetical protein
VPEALKWGLNMNIAKTKYMSLGTDTNHLEMHNGDETLKIYVTG